MNLDEIWKTHTAGTQLDGSRPDFRFDAEFYARLYPDAAAAGLSPGSPPYRSASISSIPALDITSG